jgi:hypothetical protein
MALVEASGQVDIDWRRSVVMERLSSVVGDPLSDPGFRFAPTNAKGVLLLFVRKIEEFHMYVEEVPEEFPDCYVRQRIEGGWKRLAVVSAFHSSALRTRGPALSGYDLVVCWEHDWPDCPLEVIKLRTVRLEATSAPAHAGERQRLGGYLTRQPAHLQRVFRRLDQGIRALTPHILTKTTRGRKGAGGVSYYAPELRFCVIDFLRTGRGMTFSVFTGDQRWEGVKPSLSAPWGFCAIHTEADLPKALALAKAAYETRKRAR